MCYTDSISFSGGEENIAYDARNDTCVIINAMRTLHN